MDSMQRCREMMLPRPVKLATWDGSPEPSVRAPETPDGSGEPSYVNEHSYRRDSRTAYFFPALSGFCVLSGALKSGREISVPGTKVRR
jgi:hypothetical protein